MKRLSLLFVILLVFGLTWAQDNSIGLKFRHYTTTEGLASNNIHCLIQDKTGYIWIGSENGLCRFDGQTFTYPRCSTENLGVYSLVEEDDHMWVGTDHGLFYYSTELDSLMPSTLHLMDGSRITVTVTSMGIDKGGTLWIATLGQRVCARMPGQETLHQFNMPNAINNVAGLLIDNSNQVWTFTSWSMHSGLARYNQNTRQFETYELRNAWDEELQPLGLSIMQDEQGKIYLGSWNLGLISFNPNTHEARVEIPLTDPHMRHIHTISAYDDFHMLIGSDNGLTLYMPRSHTTQYFGHDELRANSLCDQFVYPILRDREGGLWVGTYYGGLDYANPRTPAFTNYNPSNYRNSVSGEVISRFLEDDHGRIWITSDDGGFCYLDPSSGVFTPIQLNHPEEAPRNAHCLAMYKGEIWVGTYTNGIDTYNPRTGTRRHYPLLVDENDNTISSSCYSLYVDRSHRLWVGTMGVVCIYDPERDIFTRMRNLNALAIDITEDRKGNIWITTIGNGIWRYNSLRNEWKKYTDKSEKEISYVENCLEIDPRGEIWIGSLSGLLHYNTETDKFESVEQLTDVRDIRSIVSDRQHLWLAFPDGLVRYTPDSGEKQFFSTSDGIGCTNFCQSASLQASDGRIYLGTTRGFTAFYPHQVMVNRITPKLVLTGLDVYHQKILPGSEILPKEINSVGEIHLDHDEDVFSISFAALSFCDPERIQYSAWMEGYESYNTWINMGNQHKAVFTNLSAGSYTFHVRGTNNDGLWSQDEAQVRVIIHPPFYWTRLAQFIYLMVLAIGLLHTIRFFLRRNERKHRLRIRQLEQENAEQIQEARIRFFTTIAHEIRTPVSLIIAPLEKIRREANIRPVTIRNDLDIIARNSQRLLQLVNQLLDFRRMENGSVYYRFRPLILRTLLENIVARFEPPFNERGIQFDVVYPASGFTPCLDSEAVNKLISNLLANALKYTRSKVSLKVEVMEDGETFTIAVGDDGQGISAEEQQKIFRPFYQAEENKPGTGIGLSIVKGIVDAHMGNISVESALGEGTTFLITLPSHLEESPVEANENDDSIQEPTPAAANTEETANPQPEEQHDGKRTLLIVDDNDEMLNFLSESLQSEYRILTALDGQQALLQLRKETVDLIVSDWMMPVMDGDKFCREVRRDQNLCHIPFVMLTAKTDDASKVHGMNCGADSFIEKPFSLDYLRACLQNLLRMRYMLAQKFQNQPVEPIESLATNSLDADLLTRLEDLIEANFSNPNLSIEFLANELGISRSGFFSKLHSLADVSPTQMIQIIRLRHAALLIREGEHTVTEISYMVGFSSPSYFAKCFQKQFGVKPSEYNASLSQ